MLVIYPCFATIPSTVLCYKVSLTVPWRFGYIISKLIAVRVMQEVDDPVISDHIVDSHEVVVVMIPVQISIELRMELIVCNYW